MSASRCTAAVYILHAEVATGSQLDAFAEKSNAVDTAVRTKAGRVKLVVD